jgi:SP family facilitated glucose transporter-like MFS transporter 8
MKNKTDAAKNSLKRFRNDENSINNELNDLIKEEEIRKSQNALDALNRKSSKRALVIAVSLMFFQQFSGINAVIFYTNAIFADANVDLDPKYATIIIGVIQVIATFISTMTVDKLGRKILLMVSFGLMGVCTMTLGIYYALGASAQEGLGWLTLTSLCVFIIAFSLGAGPLPWLCISEIFASDVRAVAGAIAGTLNWTLAFVVTITYPPIREAIGPSACFLVFAILSFIGVAFAQFFVPETKGKSIAEIQKILGDR